MAGTAIFPTKEDELHEDTAVLRYMSFAKLVSTVASRALHLCRIDELGERDRFEGSLPRGQRDKLLRELARSLETDPPREVAAARKRMQASAGALEWRAEEQIRAYTLALRRSSYVSCWSQGPESEAMWRLYCSGREGIALVSTYGKLKRSLSEVDVSIGPVQYIDYRRDELPGRSFVHQLMHKRIAFEHEREIRILHWSRKHMHVALPNEAPSATPANILLPWNVETTVDAVVISPFAPDWHYDAVADVLDAFAPTLRHRLAVSELCADPIF